MNTLIGLLSCALSLAIAASIMLDEPQYVLRPRREADLLARSHRSFFSALDMVGYYERMAKSIGGAEQVRNWSRLYLVPGMGHCGGGPESLDSFDALTALTQ